MNALCLLGFNCLKALDRIVVKKLSFRLDLVKNDLWREDPS